MRVTRDTAAFTGLTELNLSSMDLTGPPLHQAIKLLPPRSLKKLNLGDNELGGTITSDFAAFSKLGDLNLESMQLTGPPLHDAIKLLPSSLEKLNLGDNEEFGGTITSDFAAFSKLKDLDLSGMGLTAPPLDETFELLTPVASTLEVLCLGGNALGGTITSDIVAFTRLTTLLLFFMDVEGAPLPRLLPSSLELLVLADNDFTGGIPSEWGALTNLEELDLARNALGGRLPEEMGGLVNLTSLDLSDNSMLSVTAAETAVLMAKLPKCKTFHVHYCGM